VASIDITMTGAAVASPTPAAAVSSSCWAPVVALLPFAAPFSGSGLSSAGIATTAVRRRGPIAGDVHVIWLAHTDEVAGTGVFVTSSTSTTPGHLPPSDPLS
jgi:hypothetical protein